MEFLSPSKTERRKQLERAERLWDLLPDKPDGGDRPSLSDSPEKLSDKYAGLIVEAIAQSDARADNAAVVVQTIADLRALDVTLIPTGALILVSGYYSAGDGGGGLFRLDKSDTATADDGGATIALASGPRAKAIFADDNIDVRRFGAKVDGSTNDNAAVQAALAYQQLTTGKSKTLFFPGGTTRITQTLQATNRPLYISGIGCSFNSTSGTSTIRMATDNTPIVKLVLDNERVSNVHLQFANYQPAANTSAIGIWFAANSYKACVRGVSITKVAYGLYSAPGTDAWQHSAWDIYVNGFSVSGVYLDGAGTEWSIGNVYVQNLISPTGASFQRQIVSAVRSGAQVSFTLSSLPDNIAVNRFIQIFGIDATYNKVVVVKTLVGNVVTVDYTADPGYNPVITASSTLQFAAQVCTAEAFRLGYGMRASLHAIDVEHAVTSGPYMVSLLGPSIVADKLYFEQLYSSTANHRLVQHDYGDLTIGNVEIANCGCLPGQPGLLFHELADGAHGSIRVGAIGMRDFAYSGSTLTLCTKTRSAPDLLVGHISQNPTSRANASSVFTAFGNVQTFRTRSADAAEAVLGSSGTAVSVREDVVVTQSGTAGYVGWDRYVTQNSTGSGTKLVDRVVVDGVTKYTFDASGNVVFAGDAAFGRYVTLNGSSARIDVFTTSPTSATFGGALSTDSAVRLDYGAAVDRINSVTGNGIQTYIRSTLATANLVVQGVGSLCSVGSGAAGAGLVVGLGKGSVLSVVKITSGTLTTGSLVVADADTRADTVVIPTRRTVGGTPGHFSYVLNPGVGYTISSTSGTDTSVLDIVTIHR